MPCYTSASTVAHTAAGRTSLQGGGEYLFAKRPKLMVSTICFANSAGAKGQPEIVGLRGDALGCWMVGLLIPWVSSKDEQEHAVFSFLAMLNLV